MLNALQLYAVFIELLLLCNFSTTVKRTATLTFTSANFSYNPEYLSYYSVDILPSQPGLMLNMEMHIDRNYTHDPLMRIEVLVMQAKLKSYRSIFSFEFDFCKFFGTKTDKPRNILQMNAGNMLNVWTTLMRKYSNMPTCPVTPGHYGISQLKADRKSVPPFVVAGKYRVDVSCSFKDLLPRVSLYNSSVYLQIRRN